MIESQSRLARGQMIESQSRLARGDVPKWQRQQYQYIILCLRGGIKPIEIYCIYSVIIGAIIWSS